MVSRKKYNDVVAAILVFPDYQDDPDIRIPTASSVASFSDSRRYTAAVSIVVVPKSRSAAAPSGLPLAPSLPVPKFEAKKSLAEARLKYQLILIYLKDLLYAVSASDIAL